MHSPKGYSKYSSFEYLKNIETTQVLDVTIILGSM